MTISSEGFSFLLRSSQFALLIRVCEQHAVCAKPLRPSGTLSTCREGLRRHARKEPLADFLFHNILILSISAN